MSTSMPNTTEARHHAAAAPSPARREAEVGGTVPYRRQRGTLSEETARDGNDEMPRQLIGSDRLTPAVPYRYAAAVTGGTLVISAGACPLDADGRESPPATSSARPGYSSAATSTPMKKTSTAHLKSSPPFIDGGRSSSARSGKRRA